MDWTNEQRDAINDEGHNIIVSAGAGSGKTAVLSERVLEFVKKGYKIEEFLILTFTNLAAGEMKHRIRKKLIENNLSEANFVDTADISTFDSFASSLVKKYHFLLNLSPNLTNIDSNVMSVYKRNIIDEIFDRYYESNNPIFEKMVTDLCFKEDENLRNLVLKIHSTAELEIDKEKYLNNFIDNFYSNEFQDKFLDELTNLLIEKKNEFIKTFENYPEIPRTKKSKISFNQEIFDIGKALSESFTYDSLMMNFQTFSIPQSPKNTDEDLSEVNKSRALLSDIKEQIIKKLPSTEQEIRDMFVKQKEYAEILIDITKELDKKQWEYKLKKQAFEFNDIAKFALKVVKENEDIKLELKNKYRMIMIDEYQDTSLLQEEFIKLIENKNKYMVGDIKQSIYAFRNARSDIFKKNYDDYKLKIGGEAIDMKDNFRSRKEVLKDINTIFSQIMSDSLGGANYRKDHVIGFGNEDYELKKGTNQDYSSTFIMYDSDENSEAKKEYEIDIIAKDIVNKINSHYQVFVPGDEKKGIPPSLRDATFKDFCILMDRGKMFEKYKKVFTKYKIPLYIENDENIKDEIIVKILRNILVLIKSIDKKDYESQDFLVAFLSINRSYIFRKTDEEIYEIIKNKNFENSDLIKKLIKIIEENSDVSAYMLLEKIIYEFGMYEKLVLLGNVKKNEIYLDEFMKYFKQMSDLDYSIDDFITYFKYIDEYNLKITLSSVGSSLDSVKIMNIHKSKGLEFPVIYFSGLGAEFVKEEQKKRLSVSKRYGLVIAESKINPIRFLSNYRDNIDIISERIRLLYVSLTRAREKMIFVLENLKNEKPLDRVNSFAEIIHPLYTQFNNYFYDENAEVEELKKENKKIKYKNFLVKKEEFSKERKEKTKASKDLTIGVNSQLLELGTMLHELLEITDFKNPDYSYIENEFYKSKVKKFIESDLLKDVKKGKVFKEYEYIDNEHHGIIDLMIIYDDHIDIIDYKTKNIDDEEYDNQLRTYRKYISKKFDLPIHLYLYSIVDSVYRKIS